MDVIQYTVQYLVCWPLGRTAKQQRWSTRVRPRPRGRPRGHILKSLALASKPQVLENRPVLGSRTALFLNRWNFVGKRQNPRRKFVKTFFCFPQVEIVWKKIFWRLFSPEKIFWRTCFWDYLKKFFENLLFFWRTLAPVSLVLSLGLERVCPWPRNFFVSLASSLVSSTPPLLNSVLIIRIVVKCVLIFGHG